MRQQRPLPAAFSTRSRVSAQYIAATFPLTTLFPAAPEPVNPDTFIENLPDYLTESIASLNAAEPDDFTPSLALLQAMVDSMTFSTEGCG